MQEGAFALIDCLGFKGIWKREKPELVIKKLRGIEEIAQEKVNRQMGRLSSLSEKMFFFNNLSFNIKILLISDTVAISVQVDGNEKPFDDGDKGAFITTVCSLVIKVLNLFIDGDIPLVLRGCITYGEHICERNFIIGPAVDEAAECMDIAEGAFVWLHQNPMKLYESLRNTLTASIDQTPTQSKLLEYVRAHEDYDPALDALYLTGFPLFTQMPIIIENYKMPIKNGGNLRCGVVNPFAMTPFPEDRAKMIEKYSQVITGNKLDIWLKHQNTLEFLRVANDVMNKFDEEYINPLKEKFDGLLNNER